ncbi:MAG TPA: cell surface protein SprA [Gemmatimonadales bacterium]|jgi:hypothetical protein
MRRFAGALAALLLAGAGALAAQQPDSIPGLRALRLRSDTLRLTPPAAFAGAGRLAFPRRTPEELARRWSDSTLAHVKAAESARRVAYVSGDSTVYDRIVQRLSQFSGAELPPAEAEPFVGRGTSVLRQYADLGIQLNALIETRFERRKNLHCTASDATLFDSSCSGGFNPPRIDPQFNVRTGGVVGERVHVNVDYDTQREFDASNNIQVYYQGLEDEVLRRVEVGNITFAMPRSRFITGGIPANNFGVAASGQVGALQFGALFAQQKGNVAKAKVFTVGSQTVQPVDRLLNDRDFEPQRFFFVRNPRTLPGYPALDILNFNTAGLPDSTRVTQVRIYRHRSTIGQAVTATNLTGIQAVARRKDSAQRVGPIAWEALTPGRDYYLDPSGLWFALVSRVDQEDFLAVSYITARGDTIGTFPAAAVAGRTDTLELIYAPRSGPDVPTFFYEMRNAYRVGAVDDITRASVGVQLLVGGSERPAAGAPTFLSLLGLAQATDATTFDQYNRLFPRSRDPGNGAPLKELFVILPNLTPFADSAHLQPQFRTDSLYRTPSYLLLTQGPAPLWQVGLHYDARGGDNRGSLILGGYQIRTGSERVTIGGGGRTLQRNIDYTINYEVGQLTFLNPDSLFPQPTQVSVQFEENQAFGIAPTSIYGFQARYDLGDHGSISGLALYQAQRTTFTRPPLGFEPASNLVAGMTGNFRFEPAHLTRVLNSLPFVHTEVPSLVTLDAEIATSRPSPNQVGVAYVETFEEEAGLVIPLGENQWEYGSQPSNPRGTSAAGINPAGFADTDAVALTWQNLIPNSAGTGALQLTSQQIDPTILLQGTGLNYETLMWMALHPDTIGGLQDTLGRAHWLVPHTDGPRWRSITQPLSATGVDLSRTEYLEFWVLEYDVHKASSAGASIVFDFGTVYEDAVDFQPTRFSVTGADTTYFGRRRSGRGHLDTERDTLTGSFNAQINDNGILGDVADSILDMGSGTMVHKMPLCRSVLASQLHIYSWGSTQRHCTRHNGVVNSEDLDNDQHLDTLVSSFNESHFRYVFKFGDPRYLIRTGGTVAGVGSWKLYRIPFRSDTVQVGTPDFRQIKAMRMTFIAPETVAPESTLFFALARMKLVGAPWVKRAGTPIAGLGGQIGQPHGEVIASVISTDDSTDLGYTPPPGVTDEGQQISGTITGAGAVQINEHALRIVGNDVRAGERAEAYYRFPEGDRNFLGYRQLRVWARGRPGSRGWDNKDLEFYIKVGQDQNNFYMYRQNIGTAGWLPETVVDFNQWTALRAQVEQAFLRGSPRNARATCGTDTMAYAASNGPYVVQICDPSISPPNLTKVQELAVGIIRDSGLSTDSAELWVDDIRLSNVVNDPGYAGAVNLAINAADLFDVNISASRRDGNFRQLGDAPTYSASDQLSLASNFRLDRFGLERLGLTVPLSIRLDRSSDEPFFLEGTDVLASGLPDLRQPATRNLAWSLSVRRSRRGTRWWQKALTDDLGFSAVGSSGSATSSLSTSSSHVSDLRTDYNVSPKAIGMPYLPAFLRNMLRGLPGFMRKSQMVQGLEEGRLRLSPASISLSADLAQSSADRASFRVPILTPLDSALPVQSLTSVLRTTAGLELRPFGSMTLGASASWDRDLKNYGDSTSVGLITRNSSQKLFGVGMGFVRQRTVTTRLSWQPPVATWIRPRFAWTSDFALSRDPTAPAPERTVGDTAGGFRLPTTFTAGSSVDLSATVDPSRLMRLVFGDSAGILNVLDRLAQIDIGRHIDRRSLFSQPGFDPGAGYILGLGGRSGLLVQNGILPTSASEQVQDRAAFSLRLPLSVSVTSAFAERTSLTWYVRGTALQPQTVAETDWPNVSARWLWTPRSGFIHKIISSVSASGGYTLRSSSNVTPAIDAAEDLGLRATQSTTSKPLSVSVSWAPRITTSVSITNDLSNAEQTGNFTRGDRKSTSADVTFAFKPPQQYLPIKSDIRTSLRYQSSINAMCVQVAGIASCTPIADSHQTEYNLTMDTDLPPSVVAGLAIGYVLTDDRHLNRAFSQFTLTASARLIFNAGQVR